MDADDVKPAFATERPGNWSKDINAFAKALYTSDADLPKKVELVEFPKDLDATRISMKSGEAADPSLGPERIASGLLEEATAHANGRLHDDVAIVVIKRTA